MEQRGDQRHEGEGPVSGGGEQTRGADAEQHQADVVGGRIGEQALEVLAGCRVQRPEHGRQPAEAHHEEPPPRGPPESRPMPRRTMP